MPKSFPVLETSESGPAQPLYSQVAAHLRERVESGAIKPGERLPSFSEMKALHGVSQATMERAHAILLQAGLIERRRGVGTFAAQPARSQATGLIGVMAGGALHQHPYYSHLLEGIRDVACRENSELLLLHDESKAHWEKIDGLLLLSYCLPPTQLPFGMPCVSLLMSAGNSSVVADDAGGVREAVAHLLEIGHKKIAFMTQAVSSTPDQLSLQRLATYRQMLRQARVKADARWVRPVSERSDDGCGFLDSARGAMEEWLRGDWSTLGCTAILAQNDEAAVGIVEALQEAKIRVPQDVSVIGFDGTEISTYFRPRLTTVEVPLRQIGARAAQMLMEFIGHNAPLEAGTVGETIVLPTHLRIRESTAPAKI